MKLEKMTVYKVKYAELEDFIRSVYGFEDPDRMFSIVCMEEWSNGTHHLRPIKKEPLDKWEERDLAEWKANPLGSQYKLRVILQDLVNNGHLEEGNLLIDVFW